MAKVTVKNLPFQTVQFQFAAASMRSYVDKDSSSNAHSTKEQRINAILEKQKYIIGAATANAAFWIKQIHEEDKH